MHQLLPWCFFTFIGNLGLLSHLRSYLFLSDLFLRILPLLVEQILADGGVDKAFYFLFEGEPRGSHAVAVSGRDAERNASEMMQMRARCERDASGMRVRCE